MLNYEVLGTLIVVIFATVLMFLYLVMVKKGLIMRYVILAFSFFYGLIPLLLITMDLDGFWNIHLLRQFNQHSSVLINISFKSLVFLITLVISYVLFAYIMKRKYEIKRNSNILIIRNIAMISFSIGLVSLVMYTFILGGVSSAIELAEIMRSPFAPEYNVTALKMMQPLILLSSYLYFILYLDEKNNKNKVYVYLFIISFVLSIYYFVIFAGRLPFFLFILAFILHFFISMIGNSRISIKKIIILFFTPLLLVYSFRKIQEFDSGITYSESLLETLKRYVVEFSFPFINNFVMSNSIVEYRFFQDYFIWIVRVIPSGILAVIDISKPPSLDQINTINHGASNAGGIPVDIISFGDYQLGYIGIIVVAILFAAIIRYVELHLIGLRETSPPWLPFLYVKVVMYFVLAVAYMDFDTSIVRKLDYVLLFITIKKFLLIRKR